MKNNIYKDAIKKFKKQKQGVHPEFVFENMLKNFTKKYKNRKTQRRATREPPADRASENSHDGVDQHKRTLGTGQG